MKNKYPVILGVLIILIIVLSPLIIFKGCRDTELDKKCVMTVEVHYLNQKTDTLQIKGRQVALNNSGCIIEDWVNIACYVTSYKVLEINCK